MSVILRDCVRGLHGDARQRVRRAREVGRALDGRATSEGAAVMVAEHRRFADFAFP